jgi:hypothetical protein
MCHEGAVSGPVGTVPEASAQGSTAEELLARRPGCAVSGPVGAVPGASATVTLPANRKPAVAYTQ